MRGILFATITLFVAAIPALAQESGWIGITIEDQREGGAIVRRVAPNSPAEKAGLKEGDVVVEFNRENVVGAQQLTRLVRETPVGRTVDIRIRRDGREETLKVTTEQGRGLPSGRIELNLPNVQVFADRIARDFPRVQVNTIYVQGGVRVESLTDQMRDFFGVSRDSGVLVTSVDPGSAAAKAGVKAGDVITAVDGKIIRTPADFGREMRAGSKAALKIVRDKQEREIKIE
jgi:serine protease Do